MKFCMHHVRNTLMIQYLQDNALIIGIFVALAAFMYFQLSKTNQAVESLVSRIDNAVATKRARAQAAQVARPAPPQPKSGPKPLKEFDSIRAHARMQRQQAMPSHAAPSQMQQRLQPRGPVPDQDMRGPQAQQVASMRDELNMEIA